MSINLGVQVPEWLKLRARDPAARVFQDYARASSQRYAPLVLQAISAAQWALSRECSVQLWQADWQHVDVRQDLVGEVLHHRLQVVVA